MVNIIIILIIIIIIFILVNCLLKKKNNLELFTDMNYNFNTLQYLNVNKCNNPKNNVDNDLLDNEKNNTSRIIWMYWETYPGKKKPGYIDLCINSVKYNCGKCFKINVLDNNTIFNYLPEIKDMNFKYLNLPQKVDYFRYSLLEKYGGVWIDADILVIKCICPFFNKLKNNDYVGFGCGHSLNMCKKTLNGYSKPLNWFMISKKNSDFIKCVKKKAENKINYYSSLKKNLPYHDIGKVILSECYDELNKTKNWEYSHIPSKCQEYDTSGNKLNNIMIDFNWKDCEKERIFFPLYNTAPGYPDWFKELSEEELKNKNTYLKPLINKAFSNI
jgi:hypothetical protein